MPEREDTLLPPSQVSCIEQSQYPAIKAPDDDHGCIMQPSSGACCVVDHDSFFAPAATNQSKLMCDGWKIHIVAIIG